MALDYRYAAMTVEEYFQLEELDPNTRYEYIDGEVYAMSGGTIDHDTIRFTIQRLLWPLLEGTPYRINGPDVKVYISATRYFYPDIIVTCDPIDRGNIQAIRSPRLIIEVLSSSTELGDRTWKLSNYCAHPSIEEYLLVDSQRYKIDRYYKEQQRWIYESWDLSSDIELFSLKVSPSPREIYADVELEEVDERTEA